MHKKINEILVKCIQPSIDGEFSNNYVDQEKFAKLIIEECLRQINNTDLEDVEGGDSAVLRAAAHQVKLRFGIDQ